MSPNPRGGASWEYVRPLGPRWFRIVGGPGHFPPRGNEERTRVVDPVRSRLLELCPLPDSMSPNDFILDVEDILYQGHSSGSIAVDLADAAGREKKQVGKAMAAARRLRDSLEPLRRIEEGDERLQERFRSADPDDWVTLEWPGVGPVSMLKNGPHPDMEAQLGPVLLNSLCHFERDGYTLSGLIESLASWEEACQRGSMNAPGPGGRVRLDWRTSIALFRCLFASALAETVRTKPNLVQNETTGPLHPDQGWSQQEGEKCRKLRRRWTELMQSELPSFIICALGCAGDPPTEKHLETLMGRTALPSFPFIQPGGR